MPYGPGSGGCVRSPASVPRGCTSRPAAGDGSESRRICRPAGHSAGSPSRQLCRWGRRWCRIPAMCRTPMRGRSFPPCPAKTPHCRRISPPDRCRWCPGPAGRPDERAAPDAPLQRRFPACPCGAHGRGAPACHRACRRESTTPFPVEWARCTWSGAGGCVRQQARSG